VLEDGSNAFTGGAGFAERAGRGGARLRRRAAGGAM